MLSRSEVARAVEHWARVSPKWYPTGSGRRRPSVEPHELAQAIFMESDAALVFVGKCQDCVRGVVEHSYTNVMEPWYDSDLRTRKDFKTKLTDAGLLATWTCPACDGGENRAPVAVLLSDAADGDAVARDALLAHADLLLADGNPLGQLLNWALLLWMREPADLTHSDEAVRWLEWLTAQHELLRNRNAGDYIVTVDGHEYRIAAHVGMTASEIATALNAQGGPATFSANADGMTYTLMYGTDSHISVDMLPPPQVLEEPPPRRGHAEHVGSRLGRRLGVRR